jgi:hypothetical protein
MKQLRAAALLVFILATKLSAQSPSLTKAVPSAAQPGRTATVELQGSGLVGATEVWTSFSAKAVLRTNTEAGKATCQITPPADAPVGVGALRVAGTNGLSSLLLFMVDDLLTVQENGTNKSIATAQPIIFPTAVEGTVAESSFEYFKFTAKAGQQISVEVVAQRLGSRLDPVVRLLDVSGRELAYSDDEPGLGADSRFTHKFAVKGEYVLELRDIQYDGGAQHRYRLRLGDFPLSSVPFPMGVKQGSQGEFAIAGRAVERVKPVKQKGPSNVAGLALPAKFPGGASSSFVTAAVGTLDEWIETEPNDTPEAATKITLPAAISGRFLKPRDHDYFTFDVPKGQRLLFTAQTRSLGSPSEVYLRLLKVDGTRVADNKVTEASEGIITNTFNEGGTYRLLVEEAAYRGGPEHGYRVEIEPYAGFDLSVEADKVEAQSGGEFTLKVTATRRDFKGPISLTVHGLDKGFDLENDTIPTDKNETTLKIKLPASLAAGSVRSFSITGHAKVGEAEHSALASTAAALKKLSPSMPFPPRQLDGLIGLGVTSLPVKAADPAPSADTKKKKT